MFLIVHTTCATAEEARRIAHGAVEQHLCACAHIDAIDSVYRWQGEVCSEKEWRLSFKTVSSRYDELVAFIKQQHSYDLPAIYAVTAEHATPEYAAWVAENSMK